MIPSAQRRHLASASPRKVDHGASCDQAASPILPSVEPRRTPVTRSARADWPGPAAPPGRSDLGEEGAGVEGPVQQDQHARAQHVQQLLRQVSLVAVGHRADGGPEQAAGCRSRPVPSAAGPGSRPCPAGGGYSRARPGCGWCRGP
jgi:hypothetical protein